MATIEHAPAHDLTNARQKIERDSFAPARAFTDSAILPPLDILALQKANVRTMQPGGGSQT